MGTKWARDRPRSSTLSHRAAHSLPLTVTRRLPTPLTPRAAIWENSEPGATRTSGPGRYLLTAAFLQIERGQRPAEAGPLLWCPKSHAPSL